MSKKSYYYTSVQAVPLEQHRQYASGYVGMGNGWPIAIDRGGGVCEDCPKTEGYQKYTTQKLITDILMVKFIFC